MYAWLWWCCELRNALLYSTRKSCSHWLALGWRWAGAGLALALALALGWFSLRGVSCVL
jgi:hypothetical protein